MPIVKTGTIADFQQDMYGLREPTNLKNRQRQKNFLNEEEELEESDKNKNSKMLMANLGMMINYAKGGMPPRSSKYYRSTKSGAGMTQAGVAAYRRMNPGSKLSTAVTEDNPGPKRSARRKSYCARSAGQMKMHNVNCSKTPEKRICAARRRWKC